MAANAKSGTPLRHARGVVVSSNIGQTTLTLDGGSTHVEAYNPGHAQSLPANTVVDVLLVGTKAYILAAYGQLPLGQGGTGPVGARMYATAQTTVNNGTAQVTSLAKDWAYGGATAAGNQITVPVAGLYEVEATVSFQFSNTAPGAGAFGCNLLKNGSGIRVWATTLPASDFFPSVGGTTAISLAAGDVLTMQMSSSINVGSIPGSSYTWLSAVLLNPL